MSISNWFTLNQSDIGKRALLFPAAYAGVTWHQVLNMNIFVKLCLWIGNLGIIAAGGFGIYISALVFRGDPKRSLSYGGTFGFASGVVIALIMFGFIKAQAKLTYLLIKKRAK